MPGRGDISASTTSSHQDNRLGALLVRAGLLSTEDLADALELQAGARQHERLGRILIDLGHVTAADITCAVAASVGVPFWVLRPEMVQPEAIAAFPADYLEAENILPLSISGGVLTVAVEQFTDLVLREELARRSSHRVKIIAAEAQNIREARSGALGVGARNTQPASPGDEALLDEVLREMDIDEVRVVEDAVEQDDDLEAGAGESPIVKLVNYVIKHAVEARASDVHIEPEQATFRVRYRVDGQLETTIRPPIRLHRAVVSRIKLLAGMDISERRLPQDGAVTLTIADRAIDLRVSTMPSRWGETTVMRVVDQDGEIRRMEDLGLSTELLEDFRAAVREPNGMLLVTGPTGSGKTTTLYSVLASLSTGARNISTIEDPIERSLGGINQFQVHDQLGFTFARALRSLLRQDPDTIMVGEIRDVETARLVTQAALTGHLVLSTLHTNGAAAAVPRLVNMGVEPYLVAATLRGVLAQRLLPAICVDCRESRRLSAAERAVVRRLASGAIELNESHFGVGCERCQRRGARGRAAVFDLLRLSDEMLASLAREAGAATLHRITCRDGVPGLVRDGLAKVGRGAIELRALLEIVSDPGEPRERSAAA